MDVDNLPIIDEDTGLALLNWVDEFNKFDSKSLHLLRNLHVAANLKHNSSKMYYRGISISEDGFSNLLDTGYVKLKSKLAESWSCRVEVADKFMKYHVTLHPISKVSCGVILRHKIPKSKLILNLSELWEAYEDIWRSGDEDMLLGYSSDALQIIGVYEECELITENVCNKCDVKNIERISFRYNDWIKKHIHSVEHFINDIGLNSSLMHLLDVLNMGEDLNLDGATVVIYRKGSNWKFKFS